MCRQISVPTGRPRAAAGRENARAQIGFRHKRGDPPAVRQAFHQAVLAQIAVLGRREGHSVPHSRPSAQPGRVCDADVVAYKEVPQNVPGRHVAALGPDIAGRGLADPAHVSGEERPMDKRRINPSMAYRRALAEKTQKKEQSHRLLHAFSPHRKEEHEFPAQVKRDAWSISGGVYAACGVALRPSLRRWNRISNAQTADLGRLDAAAYANMHRPCRSVPAAGSAEARMALGNSKTPRGWNRMHRPASRTGWG